MRLWHAACHHHQLIRLFAFATRITVSIESPSLFLPCLRFAKYISKCTFSSRQRPCTYYRYTASTWLNFQISSGAAVYTHVYGTQHGPWHAAWHAVRQPRARPYQCEIYTLFFKFRANYTQETTRGTRRAALVASSLEASAPTPPPARPQHSLSRLHRRGAVADRGPSFGPSSRVLNQGLARAAAYMSSSKFEPSAFLSLAMGAAAERPLRVAPPTHTCPLPFS